ncbi:glutamine amidotransferase [Pseudomonas sp. SWI6]|nr:glutamine amidotransferase [Pseudomonas sp. SWI6]PTC01753.1 glutamine amidotransferase [Thalassospira xiamenensis]
MVIIRVLICDGNTREDRASFTEYTGCTPSEHIAGLLLAMDNDIVIEIVFPADPDPVRTLPLHLYDGILFTGSNSHIYDGQPSTARQLDFARKAFASGVPLFGICWGLQLAAAAAGGRVGPNRADYGICETPFAAGIQLTDAGTKHPMHKSRNLRFDEFSFHSDEVIELPQGAVVTARNGKFIQAAEIKFDKSIFWGVQYHPELLGRDQAGYLRESAKSLVADGTFDSLKNVEEIAALIEGYNHELDSPRLNQLCCGVDMTLFEYRPLELINWLQHLVIPRAASDRAIG